MDKITEQKLRTALEAHLNQQVRQGHALEEQFRESKNSRKTRRNAVNNQFFQALQTQMLQLNDGAGKKDNITSAPTQKN